MRFGSDQSWVSPGTDPFAVVDCLSAPALGYRHHGNAARFFNLIALSILLRRGIGGFADGLPFNPALADDGFPFGTEMQLDVGRQPGSKRIPNLEIGDAGEVVLELWCKGGKGQFSVAGNTVIFVAGAMQNRSCPPDRAQADDELIAALTDAGTWKRQGDLVSFVGAKTLRFRINSN